VHDVDNCTSPHVVEELLTAKAYLCFGPDSSIEARNRGYKRCSICSGAREAAEHDADT